MRLRVDRAAAQITARIRNPNPFVVAGQAEAITGIEAWPRSLAGPYARWAVTPRIQLFTVAAKAQTTIKFSIQPPASSDPKQSFWSVVKLAYDGHVVYASEAPPPE